MSDFIEKTSPEVKWEPPVLDFTGKAYAKMMSLVSSFTTEVAWYGVVRKENDNLYHVEDVLVHPQYVSGGRVQDADEEYSKWLVGIWKQGDLFERMKLHGHSHVNFQAAPSSLDIQNYQERTEQMNGSGLKIFMIWNKRNEFWISILDYDVQSEPRQCYKYTVEGEDMAVFIADAKHKASALRYSSSGPAGVISSAVSESMESDYSYDDAYMDEDLLEEQWNSYIEADFYDRMLERYMDDESYYADDWR